jgi:hypothetical protein
VLTTNTFAITSLARAAAITGQNKDVVNNQLEFTFNSQYTNNPIPTGGYIKVKFPQETLYDMGVTVVTLVTGGATLTNTKALYATRSDLEFITINGCPSGCTLDQTINYKISWVKNPPYVIAQSGTVEAWTYTVDGWAIGHLTAGPNVNTLGTLVAYPATYTLITPADSTKAVAETTYNFIFTANTAIPKDSYTVLTFVSDVTVATGNAAGGGVNSALDNCANIYTAANTLTCTVTAASPNKIKIVGHFPNDANTGQFGVTVGKLKNPALANTYTSFSVAIFSSGDLPVALKTTLMPVIIYEPIDPSACSPTCATCAGTATTCTSCTSPSDNPIYNPVTNTCGDSCPTGYFVLDKTCYKCHDTCATC